MVFNRGNRNMGNQCKALQVQDVVRILSAKEQLVVASSLMYILSAEAVNEFHCKPL